MMIHDQSATPPVAYATPDVDSTLAERTDDACRRIHLYQQQLRADLLSAASGEAARMSARRGWLSISPIRPGHAVTALRAIESRVKALTDAGTGYAYR